MTCDYIGFVEDAIARIREALLLLSPESPPSEKEVHQVIDILEDAEHDLVNALDEIGLTT